MREHTEGRRLAECLSEAEIPSLVCVATEYGETLLPEGQFARHHAGRLSEAEMEALMDRSRLFHTVIDATHPYAVEVSANIRKAAELAGLSYRRLLREQEQVELSEDTVFVDSVKEAVSISGAYNGENSCIHRKQGAFRVYGASGL